MRGASPRSVRPVEGHRSASHRTCAGARGVGPLRWGSVVLLLLLGAAARPAEGQVERLGTISATLDGSAHRWTVVAGSATDGPYASGVWLDLGEERMVVVGGFEGEDPPVATFSRQGGPGGGPSLGTYEGSALTISIEAGADAIGIHTVDEDSTVQLTYLPDAKAQDVDAMWTMTEGEIRIEVLEVTAGRARVTGTFSGRLEPLEGGRTIQVADGRFEAVELPEAGTIQPR